MRCCGMSQVGNQLKRLADILRKVGQPKDAEMTTEQKQGAAAAMAAKSPAGKQTKRKDVKSMQQGPQNPKFSKKMQKTAP